MLIRFVLLSLSATLVLLTGCAERLDHFHRGNKIIERHFIPGDWSIPGDVSKTECRSEQMEWSTFWGKKVCGDTIDKNAVLAVDRGSVQTASYKDLVIPAAIHGAFTFGGFVALAMLSPEVQINQANYGSPIRTSTLLINAPVPGGVAP